MLMSPSFPIRNFERPFMMGLMDPPEASVVYPDVSGHAATGIGERGVHRVERVRRADADLAESLCTGGVARIGRVDVFPDKVVVLVLASDAVAPLMRPRSDAHRMSPARATARSSG